MTTAPTAPHAEADRPRLLLANSAVAFVLAAIVAVTLHEGAHAAMGLARGLTPTLFSNAVSYEPEPGRSTAILTASAGPLFSLVLGLVVHVTTRSLGRGFGRLFWLWLGLISMQNFFGYLFIAPVARAGDTGRMFALLGAPVVVYVVAFLVGAALTLLNGRLLAAEVVRYATSPHELRRLVLFAWLSGTGVVMALTLLDAVRSGLPADAFVVVLMGAVSVGIFAPLFTLFYGRFDRAYERLELRRPVVPAVLTVVVALAVFLVLAPGLRLG